MNKSLKNLLPTLGDVIAVLIGVIIAIPIIHLITYDFPLLIVIISIFFVYLISVIFHELGHLVVMKYYNLKITKFQIRIFNSQVVGQTKDKNITLFERFIINVTGPIFGVASVIIIAPIYSQFSNTIINTLLVFVLILQLLNFIPVKSFDGYACYKLVENKLGNETISLMIYTSIVTFFSMHIISFLF